MPQIERLHVITDERPTARLLSICGEVIEAGAPVIQVRQKSGIDRERFERAAAITRLCTDLGARCVINDRADIALSVGADGVHVGEEDLPPAALRRLLGDRILGVSCRDPEAARQAEAAGADYLGVGPVYATATKAGLPTPIGPEGIAAVALVVSIPVVAIGGLDARRIPEVMEAGAHGVAVISAVLDADDPAGATKELLAAIQGANAPPVGGAMKGEGGA